jgi:anthranilate phosphoribosyltransferase
MTMREKVAKVAWPTGDLVDSCGTGGDGLQTLNVSTGAAIVAAAAGCRVAKHGNRAVSSRSGSADVLEALGVNIAASPETMVRCLEGAGVGFLMAPALHGAMKYAMPARRELGQRTIFNLLGPVTNPAGANRQLVGVFDRKWVTPLAEVLGSLGADRALVAHGSDGMDEITITGPTALAEWRDGSVHETEFDPRDVGLSLATSDALRGGTAEENAAQLRRILEGTDRSAAADIVLLNGGAVIYVADQATSIEEGLEKAREVVANGAAIATLETLSRLSHEEAPPS